MNGTPPSSPDGDARRRRAKERLQEKAAGKRPPRTAAGLRRPADADTGRLLNELEVHQIELEMQNAELQRARVEVEAALDRYTDLYDFSPVGYFSIDRQGLIREANLTGAAMFGVPRSRILRRHLQDFVAPPSRPAVVAFLETVFTRSGRQACEASLLAASGAFWADLQALPAAGPKGESEWCRLAVLDVGSRKRGEEAHDRAESLAAANREANREIARRRAAEASLKESERHQRELLEESRGLHAQLRRLTQQILLSQEEERKLISRQLHDEVVQVLAGISIEIAQLKGTAAANPRDLGRRIGKTQRMVEQSIRIVHRFARELRPAMLDDLGLIPALRSYLKELADRKGLRIHFTAFAGVEALDNLRRTMLYRVAQEALTNVARHAHARKVTVRILKVFDAIRLEVCDDGKSFPVERLLSAKRGGHLGVLGMRERVELVGGRFMIESAPGEGTRVCAEVPLASAGGPASR